MSKLFGMKCYLVGAMDRVDDGGVGWRQRITPALNRLGVIVFDPCNKPTRDVGYEDTKIRKLVTELKNEGRYQEASELVKPIRTTDLRMCDLSDFLVVNIDMQHHTCGTYEEIVTANREKKPILIHVEQGKKEIAHWMLGMVPHEHIFDSWTDLLHYLTNIANGDDNRTFNRWIFFNMEGPTKQMMSEYEAKTI